MIAQVGARSDVQYEAEVGPGASPVAGGLSKPGLVEAVTGAPQPGDDAAAGAGAKPRPGGDANAGEGAKSGGGAESGQAPPKRSLWRTLSSFTNKGGEGVAVGRTPNPKPGAQGEPGSAFAGGAGAPGTVTLGSAAAPKQAQAPEQAELPKQAEAPKQAPAPAQPKRQGLWGSFSKKSEQVRDLFLLRVLPVL